MTSKSQFEKYFKLDRKLNSKNKNTNGKWICQIIINDYCCDETIVNNGNWKGRRNHLEAEHKAIYEELAATK